MEIKNVIVKLNTCIAAMINVIKYGLKHNRPINEIFPITTSQIVTIENKDYQIKINISIKKIGN